MDEPFAALDEITRFRLNNDLLTLWRDLRKTVIFVTHSVFESVYLSQRVIVMTSRPGRIAAEFRIDAAEPRGEDFRTSVEYAGYCRNGVAGADAAASGAAGPDERAASTAIAADKAGRQPLFARRCGSCPDRGAGGRHREHGVLWCASTIFRPMCCRGRRRYSKP